MSLTQKFYRDRAADARRDAEATSLDNVRAIFLRAADAWDQMATRLARTERARAETDARKAAERAEAELATVEAEMAEPDEVEPIS
jgi:hypothetical protein